MPKRSPRIETVLREVRIDSKKGLPSWSRGGCGFEERVPEAENESGYNLDHHKDAGGAIIRKALQQLEAAGYVTKRKRGRSISDEGMKKIDRLSTEIYKDIIKSCAGSTAIRLDGCKGRSGGDNVDSSTPTTK